MVTEKDVTGASSEAGVASSTNEATGNLAAGSAGAKDVPEYNRYRELDRKLSDLQSHVATLVDILSATQASKAEPTPDIDQIAEEDPVRAMKTIAARTKKEILDEQSKQRDFEKKRNALDNQALTRYPDLNNPKSELWKMTDLIIKERKADGINPETDPRAVLDAADMAFARLVQEGQISLSSTSGEVKRVKSINQGRTESSRGSSSASSEDLDNATLSEEQTFFANKLGISKEAYLKRAKDGVFWKNRKNQIKWGDE